MDGREMVHLDQVVHVFTAKPPEKSSTENLISGLQPAAASNKGFPQCTGM